jgi:hypothetical protein
VRSLNLLYNSKKSSYDAGVKQVQRKLFAEPLCVAKDKYLNPWQEAAVCAR